MVPNEKGQLRWTRTAAGVEPHPAVMIAQRGPLVWLVFSGTGTPDDTGELVGEVRFPSKQADAMGLRKTTRFYTRRICLVPADWVLAPILAPNGRPARCVPTLMGALEDAAIAAAPRLRLVAAPVAVRG